ncbi:TolC family protein [Rurimicrobium arvi]|uniref:TolC family protein n=1 Tax=Rurimicrobium arvi TaxID=2049916 RepID=A0ABP8MUQ2_9BACT
MRRIFPGLFLISLFCAADSVAQETVALTLDQAVDYAIKNSAAARNARIDVEIQQAKNREVTGRTLPQINAQGKYQNYLDPMKTVLPGDFVGAPGTSVIIPFSVKHNANLGVTGSQLLFNGSLFVALQARDALMEMARNNAVMKEEDVRVQVIKAYRALVIAQRQFEVLKSSIAVVRKGNADLQATYQAGLVEKLEVDRNSVQLNNLESDSINTANGIEVASQLLKYNMGMEVNTPIVLVDSNLDGPVADADKLLLRDLPYENRTQFNVLKSALRLQEYDLKRYRFEGLPTLTLTGNAGYNYSAAQFDALVRARYLTSSFYLFQLDIPIFDGWQRRSRVKQAKLNVEKAANDLENARIGIDFQTKSAKIALTAALQTLESRRRNEQLARSVYDLTNKKYAAGVGSNQDVILAQGDWLNAQNNYFIALKSLLDAETDLQKSLGLLSK